MRNELAKGGKGEAIGLFAGLVALLGAAVTITRKRNRR
jgi:LPXTG-motif cell wall-anchored protein